MASTLTDGLRGYFQGYKAVLTAWKPQSLNVSAFAGFRLHYQLRFTRFWEKNMILGIDGNRTTPKNRAQEEIMSAIQIASAGVYNDERMTEREKEEVLKQIRTQADRCAKIFGYKEAWPQE
jgi:hypothetical protein